MLNAFRIIPLFLAVLMILPSTATAHRLGESYVYFQVTDEALTGRFEALASDLDKAIPLDADGDGTITEEEAKAQGAALFSFFSERLKLSDNGRELTLVPGDVSFLPTKHGPFTLVNFTIPELSPVPETLTIAYKPLADVVNPAHLGFALIESNTRTGRKDNESRVSLIFRPDGGDQTLHLAGEPWPKVFKEFVIHGIWHIWLGFDHVVFLITLLLPSVMMAVASRWMPHQSFRSALWNVVKIATVFTVSHSVTLCLAALGVVTLPPTLVEAIIALSIGVVAILNMFPKLHRHILSIVFIFGLFHGFGFANVLEPLGLTPAGKVVGLAAFNIGVEIGQVAIILAAFPILWVLRQWRLYPPLAFRLGTVALVFLATVWFLERTTEFDWNVKGTVRSVLELVS